MVAGATRNAEAMVGGIEAEDGLQDQRRADAGVDRRMRAGEHQRQALVGNLRRARPVAFDLFRHQPNLGGGRIAGVAPAGGIHRLAARHREQPGFRLSRNAVRGPVRERGGEGVGQRILRRRHVAGALAR